MRGEGKDLADSKADSLGNQTVYQAEECGGDDNECNGNASQAQCLLLGGPRYVTQLLDAALEILDDGVHKRKAETGHTLKKGAG